MAHQKRFWVEVIRNAGILLIVAALLLVMVGGLLRFGPRPTVVLHNQSRQALTNVRVQWHTGASAIQTVVVGTIQPGQKVKLDLDSWDVYLGGIHFEDAHQVQHEEPIGCNVTRFEHAVLVIDPTLTVDLIYE